jgi:hypothetical protein
VHHPVWTSTHSTSSTFYPEMTTNHIHPNVNTGRQRALSQVSNASFSSTAPCLVPASDYQDDILHKQPDLPSGRLWYHWTRYGWDEVKMLYKLSTPIALSFMLQQSISLVNVLSMGKLLRCCCKWGY